MDKRQPFIMCGITGWCLELIFTGILSAVRKDFSLKGTSSLWMFPIYGMAACIGAGIEKNSACPDFFEGMFLYDWNFRCGTGKWKCAQVFQNLSLGLQQFTNSI